MPQLRLAVLACALLSPVLQAYMMIFPPLLNPMFWERPGNIPALTRLLVAYLAKAGPDVVSGGKPKAPTAHGLLLACLLCYNMRCHVNHTMHTFLWL